MTRLYKIIPITDRRCFDNLLIYSSFLAVALRTEICQRS